MKKYLLTALVAVFSLVACQKNEQHLLSSMADVLTAEIEDVAATRTYMDENNNIRWSEGDQVVAFMKSSCGHKYTLISSFVGKTYADFELASSYNGSNLSAGIEWDHNVVYYPYSSTVASEKSGSDYVLSVVLPNEQSYSEGSFGNGSMPMVAVSESNNITFMNICGGMKLQLKGTQKITSIKLEGKNGEKLSGDATVTAYTDEKKPVISMSAGASAEVVLDCGDGIQLDEGTDTDFIIAIPPVRFSKGFTVTVTDSENNTQVIETDKSNTVLRSSLLVMPVVTLCADGPEFPEEDDNPSIIKGHNPEPYFSETVELMGLLWRLAGAEEYNRCNVASVSNSADKYFASMKNHQAVNLARSYSQQNIRYDAVTGYANQLVFNEEGNIIFDPDYLAGSNSSFDDRWSYKQKNDMLTAVNDFYKESNFHDWFVSTQVEQQQAITSFKSVCNLDYSWFDSFYGKNDKITSRIILSFMIGLNNNGISLKRKDGTFLLTPVLGALNQYGGSVSFGGDMNLVVHEFSHPYCNPLIEDNWASISAKANEVYNQVSSIMENQAYGNPRTMMCETLVRSCAIRYMITHNQEDLVNRTLAYEESCGFMMVRSLIETLEKRELESGKYATLADFMPEIIDAINSFEPDDSQEGSGETADPDTLPHDCVDLGLTMSDGKKLYFATRNVGETSPGGIETNVYRWGATIEWGDPWKPEYIYKGWPEGHRLDMAHDIANIEWGGDWHIPSPEEWELLADMCDYERKEANESGYGVAGYFFYNRTDHDKFIFLPVAPWQDALAYWSSEVGPEYEGVCTARYFSSYNDEVGCFGLAGIENTCFAIRAVITASGSFDANGHDYVDLGVTMGDGKKLYFATINLGETSPVSFGSKIYRWGTTVENGEYWAPDSYVTSFGWPAGHRLDAAHDIATITWGEKWHTPSPDEWDLLIRKCDYERKEADESGYGVAGYFFYNKSDHSKFIFLPVSTWSNELEYWTSEIFESFHALTLSSKGGKLSSYDWIAGLESAGFAIRPVFVE